MSKNSNSTVDVRYLSPSAEVKKCNRNLLYTKIAGAMGALLVALAILMAVLHDGILAGLVALVIVLFAVLVVYFSTRATNASVQNVNIWNARQVNPNLDYRVVANGQATNYHSKQVESVQTGMVGSGTSWFQSSDETVLRFGDRCLVVPNSLLQAIHFPE